jgi:hypothetical protein
MSQQIVNMVNECRRQEESCLYTSVTLYEWLKALRFWRIVFVVVPIILGAIATAPLIAHSHDCEWLTAISAFIAGVFPAIYKALDLDVSLKNVADNAHTFKVLQDRFRQARTVTALGTAEDFNIQFDELLNRMDLARSSSITPPERFFQRAKKKIDAGHYGFEVDDEK